LKVFDAKGGAIFKAPTNATVVPANNVWYLGYKYNGKGDILISNNIVAGFSSLFTKSDASLQKNAAVLAGATSGSALALLNSLPGEDINIIVSGTDRLTNAAIVDYNESAIAGLRGVESGVHARMVDTSVAVADNADGSAGVSAGEEATRFGAWASPFFASANQSKTNRTSGYDMQSYGAMIGFDTKANEEVTVGIAGTYAKANLKHKNINSGDKTKSDSYLVTVYGTYNFMDDMFVQGVASVGSTKVKSHAKRTLVVATGETAKGSFNSMLYGAEVMGGYNYKAASDVVVTPSIGLSYSGVGSSKYTEKGATNQNLKISKGASNRVEVLAGAKVAMSSNMGAETEFTPEVHGFIRQALTTGGAKVKATLDGANPFGVKTAKVNKTSFDLGVGLNFKTGNYEYGVSYDANVASKYFAGQGALKLRVNF
jgi:outer membrane autotransporter protein